MGQTFRGSQGGKSFQDGILRLGRWWCGSSSRYDEQGNRNQCCEYDHDVGELDSRRCRSQCCCLCTIRFTHPCACPRTVWVFHFVPMPSTSQRIEVLCFCIDLFLSTNPLHIG